MSTAQDDFEVVVVGSGFGGAVCAHRLAAAGRNVLLLERGRPYPPGSFARTPRQLRDAFWAPEEGKFGLFEYWHFTGMDVACASGLGGGSLIYANVMLEKDPASFVRGDLAAGAPESWPIDYDDLAEHYESVRGMQRPQVYPTGTEPYASTPKTLAMAEAASALGLKDEHPPLAVLFAAADDEDPVPGAPVAERGLHKLPRSTCRLCGECDVGCNYGAKNTLDYTYLSAALDAGATLRTCCEVRTIEPLDGGRGGYRIGYEQHVEAREGHRPELLDAIEDRARTVRAKRLILAAGATGSTRLLLANRAYLPALTAAVGTRVSANGDAIALVRDARRQANGRREPRYLDPSRGPVITTSITVPADRSPSGRAYRVQDAGAPVLADWLWESLELPKLPWRMRRAVWRAIRDKLTGTRRTNLSADLAQVFTDRSGPLMPLLSNGRDIPNGRYVLRRGGLDLDWDPEPSEDYYRGVEQTLEDVADALGGRFLKSPWERLSRSITIHPLGGCPMADDPRFGVVDAWGQVFGYPGMYVADGAAMPGPVGANPSFTIAAFAERVAQGIVDA